MDVMIEAKCKVGCRAHGGCRSLRPAREPAKRRTRLCCEMGCLSLVQGLVLPAASVNNRCLALSPAGGGPLVGAMPTAKRRWLLVPVVEQRL